MESAIFNDDELKQEMESFVEVTAENPLDLLDSARRKNNYHRLKNCLSALTTHKDDRRYFITMETKALPHRHSKVRKLFSLLKQTKQLDMVLTPSLTRVGGLKGQIK